MKMKWFAGLGLLLVVLAVSPGCGYSSRDNELIGQAKKVVHNTPIICPDYYMVDVSLGVMRGGIGSMSTQDVWITVDDRHALDTINAAVTSGSIVKINYDVKRIAWCTEDHVLNSVSLAQ